MPGHETGPQPVPPPATAWHALTADEAIAELSSGHEGLPAAEADRRLAHYGPNAIEPAPPASAWKILADQLRSVVVALLFAAALLALLLGDRLEAGAILIVLLINTVIGFLVEWRARRAMEALRGLEVPGATVVRDGHTREIEAARLVPGDVIVLEPGQAVPADARLLESTELRADESVLTGESVPVRKDAGIVLDTRMPVPERANILYRSTIVVVGTARALVVGTGAATEVGRIGRLTSALRDDRTPLELRLDVLGRRLVWLTLGVAFLVTALGVLRGFAILGMVEAGIALAIAAVPEGLPAVATVTLGLGLRRMARRNALIRRLPAVEALGSATTICTDKTGTLTAGRMAVTRLCLVDVDVRVTGEGYAPEGEFLVDGERIDPLVHPGLALALHIATLANRAGVERDAQGVWRVRGDPTEGALLVAARKAGLERDRLLEEWPEVGAVPFTSERRWMATRHKGPQGARVLVKGDPERVLDRCDAVRVGDRVEPLDETRSERLRALNRAFGADGLRVLGLAYAEGEVPEAALTFVGLAGMIDPAVPGVDATIARFRRAGLRTVMITGDQRPTAESIARELGVLPEGTAAIDGRELQDMTEERLTAVAGSAGAFSRVSPEDKLRIVTALQRRGEIVAMLGDGVNDAAALRKASIGVAMGIRGTDVAREAADVVLTDDRFETVGAAIEEGRIIYDNIRKFVFYLFSCNLAEVLVLTLALLAGLPLPLLPLQILWLNMVTDTFPAFALALEPGDPDVMERPPRSPDATLLSRAFIWRITVHALALTAVSLAAYVWALATNPAAATTVCFATLGFAQILHLGNARSRDPVLSPGRALANRWALLGVGSSVALQVAAVSLPGLRQVLETVALQPRDWLVIVGLSLLPAILGQARKVLRTTPRGTPPE